jgi:hypothetical protein
MNSFDIAAMAVISDSVGKYGLASNAKARRGQRKLCRAVAEITKAIFFKQVRLEITFMVIARL